MYQAIIKWTKHAHMWDTNTWTSLCRHTRFPYLLWALLSHCEVGPPLPHHNVSRVCTIAHYKISTTLLEHNVVRLNFQRRSSLVLQNSIVRYVKAHQHLLMYSNTLRDVRSTTDANFCYISARNQAGDCTGRNTKCREEHSFGRYIPKQTGNLVWSNIPRPQNFRCWEYIPWNLTPHIACKGWTSISHPRAYSLHSPHRGSKTIK